MPLPLFRRVAEMKLAPSARAVTVPADTLKCDELEDVHLTSAVTSRVVPSEKVPVAVSWLVSPTVRRTLLPVTRIKDTAAVGTDVGAGVGVGAVNTEGRESPPHERLV